MRAEIAQQPYAFLQLPKNGYKVLFQVFIGNHRFMSGPSSTADTQQWRDRWIDAYEAGWSMTALRHDLDTTKHGHEGVHIIPAAQRAAERARLLALMRPPAAAAPAAAAPAPRPRAKAKAAAKIAAAPKAPPPAPKAPAARARAKAKAQPRRHDPGG